MSTIKSLASRVLFATAHVFDLLKATSKKMVTIPGHYRDGKYIQSFQKMVHYNPDVSFHSVATGHESASHSQKAAHKELSGMDWWNTLSVDAKAILVMSLATDKQTAASDSAAVSGWKAAASAGKNPTPPQWKAFMSLSWEKQAPLYDAAKAKAGGLAHLVMPNAVPVAKVAEPMPVVEPVALPAQISIGAATDADLKTLDYHSYTVQSDSPLHSALSEMENGSHEPGAHKLVAKQGEKIVAAAAYKITKTDAGYGVHVLNLGSIEAGAGKALMTEILAVAATKGVPVFLQSYPKSVGFYEKIGFKPAAAGGSWMEFGAKPAVQPAPAPAVPPEVAPAHVAPPVASPTGGLNYDAMLDAMSVGSYYQKEAYQKLTSTASVNPPDAKVLYEQVNALYHQLQGAASAAAAVSMFKKTMLAGKVPTPAQYKAYSESSFDKQAALNIALGDALGIDKMVSLVNQAKANASPVGAKAASKTPFETVMGNLQAIIDAKADPEALSPAAKAKLDDWAVDGYVDRLQDAADDHSSSPAYSDYAKKLLVQFQPIKDAIAAAEAPAPAPAAEIKIQHSHDGFPIKPTVPAFQSTLADLENWIEDGNSEQLKDAVTNLTGLTSVSAKSALAYAEAGIRYLEKKNDPWHPSKLQEGATKTEYGKTYTLHNGKWHLVGEFGPMSPMAFGAAAHALGIKTPTADPDFVAVHGADQTSNQTIQAMSSWHKGWDKANLAVASPKVVRVAAGTDKNAYMDKLTGPVNDFAYLFKMHGKPVSQGHTIEELLSPIEISAFDALTPEGKMDVAAAISFYGPHKLKLFQAWLSAHNVAKTGPLPLGEKPAYDHMGQSVSSKMGHSLPAQKTFHKLAAQDWMAANPSKGAEMYEALASLKLSHLAALVGPGVHPAAAPVAAPAAPAAPVSQPVMVPSMVYKNTQDGHNKFWSVSTNGNVLMTAYGKIGAKAATTKKVLTSPEAAVMAANKLKIEKTAKGYQLSGSGLHAHEADAPVAQPVAAAGPVFTSSLASEYAEEAKWVDGAVASGDKAGMLISYQNNKNSTGEDGMMLAEHIKQGLIKLGISHAWFAVDWSKMPFTANASTLENAAKTGNAHVIKSVKVGGSDKLKVAKITVLAALASPAVVSVTATKAPAEHKITAGWDFDPSNGAFSGAPAITQDTTGDYCYFAAYTDDNTFQVGVIDPQGNPIEHEDFNTAEDAAAQLNLLIDGNNAEISHVSPGDIKVLAGGIKVIGPKDGDTKPGANGETLVFKDGRWHSQAKANPIDLPDFSDDTSSWGPIYAKSANALKDAFDAGGPAAVKKLITQHKVGILAGGFTVSVGFGKLKLKPGDTVPRRVKLLAFVQALLAAKATTGIKVTASSPKSATPSSQPTMAAPVTPSVPGGGTNMSSWTQTGPQKGSNPGGKFKDKSGTEWYCKFPADADIAKNELLAAKFYQMMGVAVPNLKLVNKDGKIGIASQWVDGIKVGTSEQLAKASGAHEAFAIDAWLANWDVVGLSNDNLMLNKAGAAVRVDVGGSLLYRAQGTAKGDAFGTEVTELASLLDHATNGKSAAVFGGVSKESMGWGLQQLAKLKPSQIVELCQKAGPGDDKAKSALARKLIARRANILAKMGITDPWDKPKIDESTLTVNPSDLPKPIDFANFKGKGQGLSSVAKLNEQNTADSAALIAFAKQGNLSALKDYHYDAFDKGTGAFLGKKPITEHPAKDIQTQWSGLVELLSSIAYPPVATLDMPSTGIASSMDELAEGAGFFKPEDRVETVAAEHRLGFFMKLGQMDGVDDLVAGEPWNWITPKHAFVAAAKAGYKKLSAIVRSYISSVQASGSINHTWSLGTKTANGQGAFGLSSKVYAEAESLPDNMQMWRWMSDTTAGKGMMKQLLEAKPGLVIQNTDSMCCSYNEGWGNSAHFGSDIRMRVRCAKGSKATASFSSGSFSSENEITTLPGARFVVVSTSKGIPGNPDGVSLDVIMLPPDQGYVAELSKLEVLGKSIIIFLDSKWNNKQTPISAVPSPAHSLMPSRPATLGTRILFRV